MNEPEAIFRQIRDDMRRKGCIVRLGLQQDCLVFINKNRGILKLGESGNFIVERSHRHYHDRLEIEFKNDEDPTDKFVALYDSVCDDIREESKVAFVSILLTILANVMLWAFVFKDIHPAFVILWMAPIIVFSLEHCNEYIKVLLFKILGKLCLISYF